MIEKIIQFSARNRFLVFLMVAVAAIWGIWALNNVTLDAIPDLSDVQVIVFTEWPGRSPDLVEAYHAVLAADHRRDAASRGSQAL